MYLWQGYYIRKLKQYVKLLLRFEKECAIILGDNCLAGYFMTAWEYIIGAIIIVFSLIIIAVILLQEGRQSDLGAIAGASENFFEKGRARTLDAFLAKWTKVLAVAFFVLVFLGMLITKFLGAK